MSLILSKKHTASFFRVEIWSVNGGKYVYVPEKHWYPYTGLHVVLDQNKAVGIIYT
jgi:hypothetical protein